MNQKIIILGASGHGRVIADICEKSGDIVVGFLDDVTTGMISGIPVLGKIADIYKFINKVKFIIGIGNNITRKKIANKYSKIQWAIAIHPSALISANVSINDGTVIMAGSIINVDVQIGKHCIINSGSVVEHDCHIEDFVHISPSVTICGTVSIGEKTHVGAGATVINNVSIASDVIIGAGSVVINDIYNTGTYAGCPAHKIK